MGFFLVGEVTESRFLQVIFSEPIVITACEFLEQSASSVAQAVSLVGYVTFVFFFFFKLVWNDRRVGILACLVLLRVG